MYKNLGCLAAVCLLLFFFQTSCGQSPGNVARQSLWLRGNFSSDSTKSNSLNFNPATTLDGKVKLAMSITNLRRASIFTVYQNAVAGNQSVWQINGDLSLTTHEVVSKSEKTSMVFQKPVTPAAQPEKPVAVISTYLRQQAHGTEDAGNAEPVILFGTALASSGEVQPRGSIAEFIIYEALLTEKQITRIESYLAVKYGITLEKSYLNSAGKTIWDRKKDEVYSHNIAGIGRDDKTLLYQKQSTSNTADDQLTIAVNSIAKDNASNVSQLNDGDYLIWGDNGQPFVPELNTPGSDVVLSQKKWLMNLSGKTAGTFATEVEIDTKKLVPVDFSKEYFCLVIDRSGSGRFAPKDCNYFMPTSISADGIASFRNIQWAANGSRRVAFTFGLKTRLAADISNPETFRVYPNPLTDGHYTVAVTLDKPADIKVNIYDIHLHLVDSKTAAGQANYILPGTINAAAGVYIVKLFANNKEYSQILIRP